MWLDSTSSEADTSKQGSIAESDCMVYIKNICPTPVINFFCFKSVCLTP